MPAGGGDASAATRAGWDAGDAATSAASPASDRREPPSKRRARSFEGCGNGPYGQLPPEQSARELTWTWQRIALGACVLATSGLVLFFGDSGAALLALMVSVPFAFGAVIRMLAVAHAVAPGSYGREWATVRTVQDLDLPRYAVLVPLYREAHVVPGLVAALSEIDYPPARLEVLIVVEEVDLETQASIAGEVMPSHMRMVVVPDGMPRTKPRAINHALGETNCDYVVVFDAEDLPEPDQLKRALAVLKSDPEGIGCVQACLNVYNSDTCWLTRGIMAQTPLEVNPVPPHIPMHEPEREPLRAGGLEGQARFHSLGYRGMRTQAPASQGVPRPCGCDVAVARSRA